MFFEICKLKKLAGKGIFQLNDRLLFTSPGRYSFKVDLTYTGVANVTVHSVRTISFEVTDNVPNKIGILNDPELDVAQKVPLAPIEVGMFDSNGDQMIGSELPKYLHLLWPLFFGNFEKNRNFKWKNIT